MDDQSTTKCTTPASEADRLIGEIDSFLRRTGMTPGRFGQSFMRDHAFVPRLRARRNATLQTVDRLRAAMAAHVDAIDRAAAPVAAANRE